MVLENNSKLIGNAEIEIIDSYKYLGVFFSKSGSFNKAKPHIIHHFIRIQNLGLSLDLQLKLFDHTVLPILTYGYEVWDYENTDCIKSSIMTSCGK